MDDKTSAQPTPPPAPSSLGPNARPLQTTPDPAQAMIDPTQKVVIESLDPNGRPMEKVVPALGTEKKKPNKGLFIGIIAGAAVLFCGIIVAVVVALSSRKPDAVALAVQRFVNGEAPSNLAVNGDIDIRINTDGTPIKRLNINLDSEIITKSLINTSSATLTLTDYNNDEFSVKFSEVYAADGDLFLKAEGLSDLIEESNLVDLLTSSNAVVDCSAEDTDCVDQYTVQGTEATTCEEGEQGCSTEVTTSVSETGETVAPLTGVAEIIDGNWIKISLDEIQEISKGFVSEDSPLSCLTSIAGNLNKNTNMTAEIYGKYPFVSSTTKDVTMPGKQGPVYLVNLDSTNFTNYINAFNDSSSGDGLFSCLGYDSNTKLDENEVAKLFSNLPKIYAEVDSDYDFSRLYLETDFNDGNSTLTVDLDFSYPANVNASEPVEYTYFKDILEETTEAVGGDTEENTTNE